MDDEPRGILRIESEGNVRVSEVRNFLESLENAYNGTLVFLKLMDEQGAAPQGTEGEARKQGPIVAPSEMWNSASLSKLFSGVLGEPWYVSPREQLILRRAQLASPGSLDFLGIAAVFGVIREYLKDRDERRKDKEYREAFERERLRLENEIRKNDVIAGRLKIARDLGLKEDHVSLMLDRLVVQPLVKLGAEQDRGLIVGVKEKDIDDE